MTAQDPAPAQHIPTWDRQHLAAALTTAARYARSGARRLALSQPDREDLQQDILLTLLERSARFDPDRGSWEGFVTLVSRRALIDRIRAERSKVQHAPVAVDPDGFALGASATQLDSDDPEIGMDLARVTGDLPERARHLLHLLHAAGDIRSAQQHLPQSRASFFRSLRDLRCWLRCGGLRPSTPTPTQSSAR